jgi:hypothetical protein
LSAQPARYYFDGSDGSVYVALASVLRTHGTLRPHDAVASLVHGDPERTLFRPATVAHLPSRFPGGIELDPETDRWIPGFLHLYPVVMAASSTAFGPDGMWFVNPVFGVASVIGLWLLGRRIAGELAGIVGAGLLAINVAQVWFTRFPTAEMTAQFLVTSGLYLAVLARDTRWPAAAGGAGLLFGLVAFTRIEVLALVLPSLAAFLAIERVRGGSSQVLRWLGAVFGLVALAGLTYLLTIGDVYLARVVTTVLSDFVGPLLWTSAAVTAALASALVARRRRSAHRVVNAASHRRVVGTTARAGVALAVGGAGWLMWSEILRGSFTQLVSTPGLIVSMVGATLLLRGRGAGRTWFAGVLFIGSVAIVALCGPADTWVLPWSLRRSVPVLLPMTMLAVGVAVQTWHRQLGRVRAATLCVPAVLAWSSLWQTWPLATHHVMRDGAAALASIADVTDPSDLLIWDVGLPSQLPLAVHTTLRRTSVIALPGAASDAALHCIVEAAFSSGRRVLLVVDDGRDTMGRVPWPRRLESFRLLPSASVLIGSEALRTEAGSLRFIPRRLERRLDLYQLVSTDADDDGSGWPGLKTRPSRAETEWRDTTRSSAGEWMDVGGRDLPYVLEGFHGAEQAEGVSYRWTGARASLRVPVATGTLTLRLKSSHPNQTPLPVEVDWNGVTVARLFVTSQFAEHTVVLDAAGTEAAAGMGVLTIRSPTFVPRDAERGLDTRPLGVMVDGIRVR